MTKGEISKNYQYDSVSSHGITKPTTDSQTIIISFVDEPELPMRIEVTYPGNSEKLRELFNEFTKAMKEGVNEPESKEEDMEDDIECEEYFGSSTNEAEFKSLEEN